MKPYYLLAAILFTTQSNAAILGEFAPKNQEAFKRYISVLTESEKSSFSTGARSTIGDSVSGPFSAEKLVALYEKNELLAKKQLKGKPIRIKTLASEIGENFAGEAYIMANGSSEFKSINMIVNGEDERILSLSIGDKVDMVCESARYVMHTPILSKCVFSDVYAKNYIDSRWYAPDADINHKYNIHTKEQSLSLFLYKSHEKAVESACLESIKSCQNAASEAARAVKFDEDFTRLLSADKEKTKLVFGYIMDK